MPRDNVETIRSVYDALNREDWDALSRYAHPDFQATFKRGPDAGTYRGLANVRTFLLDRRAPFDSWVTELLEVRESGDLVVAVITTRMRPRGSSHEIQFRTGHIWTLRDGAVLSMEGFPDPDDALAAAGLSG